MKIIDENTRELLFNNEVLTATRQPGSGKIWKLYAMSWTKHMLYDAETDTITGGPGFEKPTMDALAATLRREGLPRE